MTSILADYQYNLSHFPEKNQIDTTQYLNSETIAKINALATLVGAPSYKRTPVFKQRPNQQHQHRRKKVISAADWTEIRNFKATELKKKEEGVEKDIDELRGLLNKLTSQNYEKMQDNIMISLTKIIKKNCKDEDLEKIGEAIFNIGSMNKFWSALYAKLYNTIITNFPPMQEIYKKNFENFLSLFNEIRYINAEEDYDEFCKINKENEKRRSVGSFFVHLMNNGIIKEVEILKLIYNLKEKLFSSMDEEGIKEKVEEIAENIVILIAGGKNKLQVSVVDEPFDWDACVKFIENMTKMKANEHPSLSNKVVFKFMDLEEEL